MSEYLHPDEAILVKLSWNPFTRAKQIAKHIADMGLTERFSGNHTDLFEGFRRNTLVTASIVRMAIDRNAEAVNSLEAIHSDKVANREKLEAQLGAIATSEIPYEQLVLDLDATV